MGELQIVQPEPLRAGGHDGPPSAPLVEPPSTWVTAVPDAGFLPAEALGRIVLLDDALSGCATAAQVVAATVGPGLDAFGARAGLVGLASYRLRLDPVWASPGLAQLRERCRDLSLDDPLPIAEAVRTGRPVTGHRLPDDDVLDLGSGTGLGVVRSCALPIVGARGVLGGIWLFLGPDPPPFESSLFSALIARLAAAIDRTRLLESERRLRARAEQAAARMSRLQSLTSGLSAALGAVDVADAVMTHAVAELGATGGTCFMLADDATLRPVSSIGADTGSPSAIRLTGGDPVGAVLRRSAPVVLPSGTDALNGVGLTASRTIVPLTIRGTILGAIELAFPNDREVDAELRSFLGALGTQCAQAVERARLYEQRAREAQVLQASLMPPALPRVPGLDAAAAYRPFGDGTVVGGDFYDLYPIGEERWGLVVGDVSGRGIEAAAITALARHTTRAATLLGSEPADVLHILNRVMLSQALGERFCTIVHAVLERAPDGFDVTLSLGGHPRPLWFESRTGEVRAVGEPGTALGLFPEAELRETRLTLRAADVLVFFTDGCVDVHTERGTTSDERLLFDALRRHALEGATELTGHLEAAVLASNGGRNADDAALLVLQVQTTGGVDR